VSPALVAFDALISAVRAAALFVVIVFGAICIVDWAVRTRRINPFNPVARFFRSTVDPFIAPVERRVVRAGGSPTAAPWWALVIAVVGAILLISILGFLRAQISAVEFATAAGASGIVALLVSWTVAFLQIALLVRVLSSWIAVSPYSPWIRWSYGATEWILRPLRAVVPMLGPIDITPIVAYFLLALARGLILGAL
jgi:YggT family protein